MLNHLNGAVMRHDELAYTVRSCSSSDAAIASSWRILVLSSSALFVLVAASNRSPFNLRKFLLPSSSARSSLFFKDANSASISLLLASALDMASRATDSSRLRSSRSRAKRKTSISRCVLASNKPS